MASEPDTTADWVQTSAAITDRTSLTERQAQVLVLADMGLSNEEIADTLDEHGIETTANAVGTTKHSLQESYAKARHTATLADTETVRPHTGESLKITIDSFGGVEYILGDSGAGKSVTAQTRVHRLLERSRDYPQIDHDVQVIFVDTLKSWSNLFNAHDHERIPISSGKQLSEHDLAEKPTNLIAVDLGEAQQNGIPDAADDPRKGTLDELWEQVSEADRQQIIAFDHLTTSLFDFSIQEQLKPFLANGIDSVAVQYINVSPPSIDASIPTLGTVSRLFLFQSSNSDLHTLLDQLEIDKHDYVHFAERGTELSAPEILAVDDPLSDSPTISEVQYLLTDEEIERFTAE